MSINSFAAIVSDNDGSAFITKAEFDALKSSFQAQIDSYNQSIDSKIDGAIASYLAGIKLATRELLPDLFTNCKNSGWTSFTVFTPAEQNVNSQHYIMSYQQLWAAYAIPTKKDAYITGFNRDGSGTIWAYKELNGSPYIFGKYNTAYPKFIASGTVFFAKAGGQGYNWTDPVGKNFTTQGSGTSVSYLHNSASTGFFVYILSSYFEGFAHYDGFAVHGSLTTADPIGYLNEDTKSTKYLLI